MAAKTTRYGTGRFVRVEFDPAGTRIFGRFTKEEAEQFAKRLNGR